MSYITNMVHVVVHVGLQQLTRNSDDLSLKLFLMNRGRLFNNFLYEVYYKILFPE